MIHTESLTETLPAMDTCFLCGVPIPDQECPLCAVCEQEEDAKSQDYLAEREQAWWPI